MSLPLVFHTYRLVLRPVDEQMTLAELANRVQRVLLTLSDVRHGVSIIKIGRPSLQAGNDRCVEVEASGPEHWALDIAAYLQSQGLRAELRRGR